MFLWYLLEEITKRTTPIAIKHGVNRLCLFGSYARNEARDDSDLDFIMDYGDVTSLIKYMSFVQDLEDEFKCHVDLVSACSYIEPPHRIDGGDSQTKNFFDKTKKRFLFFWFCLLEIFTAP